MSDNLDEIHNITSEMSITSIQETNPTFKDNNATSSMSLSELYVETQRMRSELSASSLPALRDPASRREYETILLDKIHQLDRLVESRSLFSPNEIIDDVQTSYLKYLLVSYQLGDALLSRHSTFETRENDVKAAKIALRKFFDRCDHLMLVNEIAKKDVERLYSTDSSATSAQIPSTADITSQRNEKIERYKREKSLMQKLEMMNRELEDRRRQLQKQKGGKVGESLNNDDFMEDADLSENEREVMLLTIELTLDKAISHLRFIETELQLLDHGKKQESQLRMMRDSRGTAPGLSKSHDITTHNPSNPHIAFIGPDGSSIYPQQNNEESAYVTVPGEATRQYGSASLPGASVNNDPKPLKVYNIREHKDATAPIPPHMKEYLRHVNVKGATSSRSDTTPNGGGGGCGHPGSIPEESDQERLNRNWFRPNAHACEHCGDDDVTKRPEFTKYMLDKKRGGRGKLIPACPIHGNAHPAGQCPGLTAGRGGAARGAQGYADPITARVQMSTDRAAVFRDNNPYLMELDDWVLMKQKEGSLPGERDVQLSLQLQQEEENRSQRIADGIDDDDEQMKTQKEIYDEEDEAQMKARDWDEFTDHVQKGSGNRNYRR